MQNKVIQPHQTAVCPFRINNEYSRSCLTVDCMAWIAMGNNAGRCGMVPISKDEPNIFDIIKNQNLLDRHKGDHDE